MATEQDIPQPVAMSQSGDPLSKLYREIGISALAAALAGISRKSPCETAETRKESFGVTS